MSGPQMYEALCSACHGSKGDGSGPGSRSVWPPPRNFRRDKFRLVSSQNRVPTLADIEGVIEQGMPGTSMTSFEGLTDRQRTLLAEQVLRLRRDGVRDRAIEERQQDGVPNIAEEVEAAVRRATTPAEIVPLPVIEPSNSEDIARGQRIYRQQRCDSCHGEDGVGAWDVHLRDDEGPATRPRDLVHEPFKGGHQPESIYLRLRLGMPGTPHPSSPSLSEQQLIDLVHYCRSLAKERKLNLTGHQRRTRATSQSYLRALGRVSPQ
ncbi:MAG: hypothetical protein CMJ64_26925 [Planctomycetaceae bacterium]|nr:hypothetical protein [Planctomycetaceae bacterium]